MATRIKSILDQPHVLKWITIKSADQYSCYRTGSVNVKAPCCHDIAIMLLILNKIPLTEDHIDELTSLIETAVEEKVDFLLAGKEIR